MPHNEYTICRRRQARKVNVIFERKARHNKSKGKTCILKADFKKDNAEILRKLPLPHTKKYPYPITLLYNYGKNTSAAGGKATLKKINYKINKLF